MHTKPLQALEKINILLEAYFWVQPTILINATYIQTFPKTCLPHTTRIKLLLKISETFSDAELAATPYPVTCLATEPYTYHCYVRRQNLS